MLHIVLFVTLLFTSCNYAGFTSDTMVHTHADPVYKNIIPGGYERGKGKK